MKPLTLHVHPGPNPWKVALILEELSLPYQTQVWNTADQKKPPFTTLLNPNGFTPVLEDPNTAITIWESGAIIQYILETYDAAHALSFSGSEPQLRAQSQQYSFFQATFQGPNISNAVYFRWTEPNAAAHAHFLSESRRVLTVLETALEGGEWLVGARLSAADLAFVPYTWSFEFAFGDEVPDLEKDWPNVDAWLKRMHQRPAVSKVKQEKGKVFAASMAALARQKAGK